MKHYYRKIEGFFPFYDLYKEMVEKAKDGDRFVEIGVFKGKSTAFMAVEIANSGKAIDFHAVDHFKGNEGTKLNNTKEIIDGTLEKVARNNLKPVSDYVTIHSCKSHLAPIDGPINFLFIDGDHTYEGVKRDLDYYLPKMAPDGVIGGDDWNGLGVQKAVYEKFSDVKILGENKGRYFRVDL